MRLGPWLRGAVVVAVTALLLAPTAAPAPASPAADQYGRQAFREANEKRTARELDALDRDRCLQQAAVAHAREMARRSRIFDPALRPIRTGCGLTGIASNTAGGFERGEDAVRAWMGVPDDREELLRPLTTLLGSAARRNEKGTWYVVQLYGSRRSTRTTP